MLNQIDKIKTPFFLIDEKKLIANLEKAKLLKSLSGVKLVLALKCFSTWGVFKIIEPYLDGTTSSGPNEVRLGFEKFGKETHSYSVGYSEEDILEVRKYADKIIFNSESQFLKFYKHVEHKSIGIRLNPGISYAHQDLANPARPSSRLGVPFEKMTQSIYDNVDDCMFHINCENKSADNFIKSLDYISEKYAYYFDKFKWVSFGGGVFFTWENYDIKKLALALKDFSKRFNIEVYLEPGEAIVTKTTDLVVTVLDIVENQKNTVIVDSATEAHRLDTLIYNEPAQIKESSPNGAYNYVVGSCSCLAGDQFCEANFDKPLEIGQRLHIEDSAGYTMVKLNWFNGLKMPSIVCKRLDNTIDLLKSYDYMDFERFLSDENIR